MPSFRYGRVAGECGATVDGVPLELRSGAGAADGRDSKAGAELLSAGKCTAGRRVGGGREGEGGEGGEG